MTEAQGQKWGEICGTISMRAITSPSSAQAGGVKSEEVEGVQVCIGSAGWNVEEEWMAQIITQESSLHKYEALNCYTFGFLFRIMFSMTNHS